LSGGNNTWMYHLTQVLLFGLISCLLFLLLRKFLIPLKLALISTLIFCAHPLFIPSITWIPARGDLLLFFFSLLSFLFFIEYLQKKKFIYLFLHWLTFTLALFCKETAAVLTFLFIIYYFAFSSEKRFEKKYLLTIALYAISGIVWFWLRSIATGNPSNQNDVGLITLLSNLRTIPESLTRFFLPYDSTFISSFSLFCTLAGVGIIIIIIVIFLINKERTIKEKIFCLSWFLFLMLPALIIKEDYIDYLTHRFFLPLIGILLFVLFSFPKKWFTEKDIKKKIIVNGGYFCIFAILACLTFINSRSYSDSIIFYNSYISKNSRNPNNVLIYTNRGSEKYIGSDFQGAISDFTKAIELNPDFAIGYNDLGTAYAAKGDFEQAIKEYDKSIELFPNYVEAYNNRGKAYADKGIYDQAIKDYNKAIVLNPNFADAYNNRGTAYSTKGDLDNAIKNYIKAIELNPYYGEAYNNLGLAYQSIGDPESAIKEYNRAIELKPALSEAYYNRGNSYSVKGNFDNAVKDYDKAIKLNPNYAEAYNNLGLAYQDKGDLEIAIKDYDKAIELKPALSEAYYNRGNYYLIKGNFESAIKDYDKAIELRPGYAEAYGIRGIAYSEKGDLNSAIKNYNKAIELNPHDANAYGNLGNAYKAKGMLKEADQYFKMYEKLK
jgi:tetratricopeptide (TPR) repeat protein